MGRKVSRETLSIPLDLEVLLHGKPSDIYNAFSPLPSQMTGLKFREHIYGQASMAGTLYALCLLILTTTL